jgi:hypothetical protein
MKPEFNRTDGMFSLCGLNCGLCPMQLRGECSGCFNGSTCYQGCPIAPCSVRHGNVDYCFQCSEYPCKRYDGIDRHDSLISHRNQKTDMAKAKEIGIAAYLAEQQAKQRILFRLLDGYDAGGAEVFYCLAVNLLALEDLEALLARAEGKTEGMLPRDKEARMRAMLSACADRRGITLELRPW